MRASAITVLRHLGAEDQVLIMIERAGLEAVGLRPVDERPQDPARHLDRQHGRVLEAEDGAS